MNKIFITLILLFILIFTSCNSSSKNIENKIDLLQPDFTINGSQIKNDDQFIGKPDYTKNEIYNTFIDQNISFRINKLKFKRFDENKIVYWRFQDNDYFMDFLVNTPVNHTYRKSGNYKVTLCFDKERENCVSKWIKVNSNYTPTKELDSDHSNPSNSYYNDLSKNTNLQSYVVEEPTNIDKIIRGYNNNDKVKSLMLDNNNRLKSLRTNYSTNNLKHTYTGMKSNTILNANSNKCELINQFLSKSSIKIIPKRELKLKNIYVISQGIGKIKLVFAGYKQTSINQGIHTGTNNISLTNISEILRPNKTYLISIETIASSLGTPKLKVVNKCIKSQIDSNLSVDYNDPNGNVLFNLKYNY